MTERETRAFLYARAYIYGHLSDKILKGKDHEKINELAYRYKGMFLLHVDTTEELIRRYRDEA